MMNSVLPRTGLLSCRRILKVLTVLIFLTFLGGCSLPHIGMYVVEDGTAPDADQDGVPDDQDECRRTPLGMPVDEDGCPDDDDEDMVANGKDQCPRTPKGIVVDAWGCSVDSDGDGVLDSRDECPETSPNTGVDGTGCTLDGDGDGVLDYKDRCKGTLPGAKVDRWGCAQSGDCCSELCRRLPTLSDVHFEHDRATLRPEAYSLLNEAVIVLKEYAKQSVIVVGHTDSNGTEGYNIDLSERRAKSVMDYLVGHGVDDKRLTSVGKGESDPLTSNKSEGGRAANRRVVFVVE